MAVVENVDDKLARLKLNPSKPAFGIDLGTTNSAIGYLHNGRVEILNFEDGTRTIPSYVCYNPDGPTVGNQARRLMSTKNKLVAYDAKRMIGLNYENSAIQQNKDFWTFTVVEQNKRPVYDLGNGRKILPEQVSADVLKELKKIALERVEGLNESEFQAVITVPDYFNQAQKQGTMNAAQEAGIDVLGLITEPNAAAFAYGYDHNRFDDYSIFVFDMGGGTCDISILKVKEGKFEIVGRAGDNQLGGRDFDNLLMNYYANILKEQHGVDIFDPNETRGKIRLRELCEEAKKRLTNTDMDIVELSHVKNDLPDHELTYDIFRKEVNSLVVRAKKLCENALKESKIDISEIDEVLLVGGSCRMRVIKKMLKEFFPNQALKESINPDEAIAYGATVRAAQFLDSNLDNKALLEKLPIGIGVGLLEDRYEIVLRRNTHIPCKPVKKNYVTSFNNQEALKFVIYEGERVIASKNTCLGSFTVKVPKKPAGEITVPLTMSINRNGILVAYAEYNGERTQLAIESDKMTSGDGIQEMLNALEVNRQTDKAAEEAQRARSQLRTNIEFIKAACEKESNKKNSNLIKKIKEIDDWLSKSKAPLTQEIRDKFISIEDEAKTLLNKYHKTLTSFKTN